MADQRLKRLADAHHDRVVQRDQKMLGELSRRYGQVASAIDDRVTTLVTKANAARNGDGVLRPSWLYEQNRLASLKEQVQGLLDDYSDDAEGYIAREMLSSAVIGEGDALDLMDQAAGGLHVKFDRLPDRAIAAMVGRSVHDDRPLSKVLARLPGDGAEKMARQLVTGIALGRGPVETAGRCATTSGATWGNTSP
jgi:hypothetical protein